MLRVIRSQQHHLSDIHLRTFVYFIDDVDGTTAQPSAPSYERNSDVSGMSICSPFWWHM